MGEAFTVWGCGRVNWWIFCVMLRLFCFVFLTQTCINRASHHAKTQTWSASAPGRLKQYQGRDCSHTTYLIATDNQGVSQHTGIFTKLYHPQHQTWDCSHSAYTQIYSVSFTEHYSFATDAVEILPARPGRGFKLIPSLNVIFTVKLGDCRIQFTRFSPSCGALQAGNLIKIMPSPHHPHSPNTENTRFTDKDVFSSSLSNPAAQKRRENHQTS